MTNHTQEQNEMNHWRKKIFPIANTELKKFLPMAIIMMMILFNYTVMRDTKDALVTTHPVSDAEVISFLKLLLTTPASLIFVILFTKMVNVFSSEKIFYIIVIGFLIFFGLFGFVLYPYSEFLHPSIETVKAVQASSNPFFKTIIGIWGMWTYALFYTMSELWGTSMISLLFWKFANEIIKTNEAKRFYPMLILLSNIALIFSGEVVTYCSKLNVGMDDFSRWGITLRFLTTLILIAGVIAILAYRWMHTSVLTDKRYYNSDEKKIKKSKPKMSVMESFIYVLSSPYLMFIALLILSYGASIHIVEVAWKKSLKIYTQGNPNEYNAIMGQYSKYTGVVTIVLLMFVKGVIARFGWFVGAIITPIILGTTGLLFLTLFLFADQFAPMFLSFGVTALGSAVVIGALQGILSKATKYSLFDPTKEMAYIPLDDEIKAKGKAAVDVIGGRLGKSSGGVMLVIIYAITGVNNIRELTHIIMVILAVIICLWIFAVFGLSKRYNRLIAARKSEEKQVVLNNKSDDENNLDKNSTPKDGETNFVSKENSSIDNKED